MELILLIALLLIAALLSYKIQQLTRENTRLKTELARLDENLRHAQSDHAAKLKVYESAESRLKQEFENLANRIFEEKGRIISADNREKVADLLKPFQQKLDLFRQRVDEIHTKETQQSAGLLKEVENLARLSGRVSQDADNLARAIKGDAKVQGDWGEIIVERIFEASGLRKGEEFAAQTAIRSSDGSLQKPDFIVYLPDNKAAIVDSKVSLTAYERYCNEEDPQLRNKALAEHVASIRKHVSELQQKQYGDLLGNRTLDFVILCIPLESAYQEALKVDKKLLYDTAGGRIVITGPTTLMIALKLIAQIWRRDHENRNAEKIADQAGKLYDQVALVVSAMLDSQKKLAGAAESFDLVIARLSKGRGNLIGRVESIRKLGAKVSRSIPADWVEDSEDPHSSTLEG